jgi:predicted nucleic acid-binding protein
LNLQPLTEASILVPCDLSPGPETVLFVELARQLDDGEAMALAIAKTRGWPLATDDRKAARVATGHGVCVITTPELVKRIAESARLDGLRLSVCLQRIEDLACFWPHANHPLRKWWSKNILR